jgi:hypothetical protein
MRQTILILTLALFARSASAQEPTHRYYSTQNWMAEQLKTDPTFEKKVHQIEQFTTNYKNNGTIDTVTVALVFHLFPLPDSKETPNKADVQAQIDRLVTDFYQPAHPYLNNMYQHPAVLVDVEGSVTGSEADIQPYLSVADNKEGFAKIAGNPSIHFCIAVVDANGQPTDGILYPSGVPQIWKADGSIFEAEKKGNELWNPELYCNIYVAQLDGETAGYAQRPGFNPLTDGIVLDARFFAKAEKSEKNPFCSGKTLSHLMGSYLNLHELWNEYVPCGDDLVDDTPIHNASNEGLPSEAYQYKHVSTCEGNPVEMLSNLMDDTPDSLQYLFTIGQVMRMQATLATEGPRGKLRKTLVECKKDLADKPDNRADDNDPKKPNSALFSTKVYPNPTSGKVTLQIDSKLAADVDLQIVSTNGSIFNKTTLKIIKGVNYQQFDASEWSPGLYTMVVLLNGKASTARFMVEKL